MTVSGTSLLQALAGKMRWHQERQQLLAQNIANADTPGYQARDLADFSFGDEMKSLATVTVATTSPMHIEAASDDGGFASSDSPAFEVTPSGNGVTLEDQMMKVTSNDMDYQTVTALYTRSLRLIRTALGEPS
jgi:flagellar basal-body rod protein FlgB